MHHNNTILPLLEKVLCDSNLDICVKPFADYLLLLQKWNSAYNLTAIRNIVDMVSMHIADSLAILPWLQGPNIIDIGTGAGLPGLPIALARPDLLITLLDSNGKKVRFLREVQRQLAIKNITVVQKRAEQFIPSQCYNTITSRAFSNLAKMVEQTKHLKAEGGIWLAMKGQMPQAELNTIASYDYSVKHYEVANITGARCCVIIR